MQQKKEENSLLSGWAPNLIKYILELRQEELKTLIRRENNGEDITRRKETVLTEIKELKQALTLKERNEPSKKLTVLKPELQISSKQPER